MLDTLSDRNKSLLQMGIWSMSAPDQAESGDRHLIKVLPNGVLVGVVDGLGHGEEAAVAAKAAIHYLGWYARDTLIALFQRCHLQLKNTRGVVMSLAFFNADQKTMTWLGVGNVEGLLLRADASMQPAKENILLRGGVVGLKLPPLYASVVPVFPGDTLIFATDGIAGSFGDSLTLLDTPQNIANRIGVQFKKEHDDALVLVARYTGTTYANLPDRA